MSAVISFVVLAIGSSAFALRPYSCCPVLSSTRDAARTASAGGVGVAVAAVAGGAGGTVTAVLDGVAAPAVAAVAPTTVAPTNVAQAATQATSATTPRTAAAAKTRATTTSSAQPKPLRRLKGVGVQVRVQALDRGHRD